MTALRLDQAQAVIAAALARSRQAGYQPMAIAVLDASGHLKAFASEDGASMFRFDIARAKAWGAVGMGVASGVLAQRAKDNPHFFVALAATGLGNEAGAARAQGEVSDGAVAMERDGNGAS